METRGELLTAATRLFAERGFHGASIRDITAESGASVNAVHYHFGSKEALYREIVGQLASEQLAVAERVLSTPARSSEELAIRLQLFLEELLVCYLDNRDTVRILFREYELLVPRGDTTVTDRIFQTNDAIANFVREGIEANLIRPTIDPDIVAGLLLDRVLNQARFTDAHRTYFDVSTLDEAYRAHWIQSTLDVVLHGICGPGSPVA